jgi:hypothetical protein
LVPFLYQQFVLSFQSIKLPIPRLPTQILFDLVGEVFIEVLCHLQLLLYYLQLVLE